MNDKIETGSIIEVASDGAGVIQTLDGSLIPVANSSAAGKKSGEIVQYKLVDKKFGAETVKMADLAQSNQEDV